jgi:hypothetical protein
MQAPAFPAGWQSPVWSMLHAGLSDRADLPSEPLWRCPAMGVTADTVEILGISGVQHIATVIERCESSAVE